MNTIKIDRKNCKLVAHAGHGLETENTIAGFIAAGNRDYYAIETDMHVTKDKKFVILHNDNMLAISGVDKVVKDSTLEELQAIPIYDKYDGTFRSDLRVPEVSEYIKICKKYEKVSVLEIKNHMPKKDIKRIVDIIRELKYLDNTVFISFDFENLVSLREISSKLTLQYLVSKWSDNLTDKLKKHKMDIDIYHKEITKERVRLLHKNGILVNAWTVDTKDDAKRLISCGVDYITTNILE